MLTRADFESDAAYLKYLACRDNWHRRDQLTPRDKIPWGKWFERKFGQPIEEARREYINMQTEGGSSHETNDTTHRHSGRRL